LRDAVDALRGWLDQIGPWGVAVYAVIYALATVLLVPGSILTLAAGAIFGLLWGTVAVSIGSTTGAALALLIARYLARDTVARKVRRYPKFDAVDRAVAEGGWKIVAMLRLSPAVPFNVQNYLYGLTAIPFWTAVLTSWVAMLPGTVMYVYIGYLARAGAAAAAGAETVQSATQWTFWVVGFAATVALTVYLTRLARRKIAEQTGIIEQEGSSEPHSVSPRNEETVEAARGWPWGATVAGLLAVFAVAGALVAYANQDALSRLFGPPAVTLDEAYQRKAGGARFDHSAYDDLLHKFVDADGWVDYAGLKAEKERLASYIASVAEAPFDRLGRDEKLALLINAYNAFTLQLILEHYPVRSIKDIPADKRWKHKRWKIGSMTLSLDKIEHEQIRPKFKEPRVHFALVCAAIGCPILRNEAYVGDRIEQQLEEQAKYVHTHHRWLRFNQQDNIIYLTQLYKWYGGDFEQVAGSVLTFAARYVPTLELVLDDGRKPQVRWLQYDWTLNDVKNRK
jgi:uncharacterized membrane protein YdjX (TVP38/TMEM64 family)